VQTGGAYGHPPWSLCTRLGGTSDCGLERYSEKGLKQSPYSFPQNLRENPMQSVRVPRFRADFGTET